MFEITTKNKELFEYYKSLKLTYPDGEYDFTFEYRYLIYHAPLRNQTFYIALDTKTKRSSVVYSRDNGVCSKDDYWRLIPDILYSIKYVGDRRFASSVAQHPLETIDLIFRTILPANGFAVREEQIKLSKQMYQGLTEKKVSICEAEVGTGKTMAYLVAAFCARKKRSVQFNFCEPITISTSSIELQKALIDKEIPRLSNILLKYRLIRKPLTAVLRKGKEHYFCLARYEDYWSMISQYPSKFSQQMKVIEKLHLSAKTLDLDTLEISEYLKKRICVKGKCTDCPHRGICRYANFIFHSLNNREDLDFQVTNHNLYLTSTKYVGVLRPSSMVIIDEAHKFKDAAQNTYGEIISEEVITKYINWTYGRCKRTYDLNIFNSLRDVIAKENTALFSSLRAFINADDPEDNDIGKTILLPEKIQKCILSLSSHLTLLHPMISVKERPDITAVQLSKMLLYFKNMSVLNIWCDLDENNILSLCCCPKNIATKMMRGVWDGTTRHVLTSGTMSDGVNFDFFKHENGLEWISNEKLHESSTSSPFDYLHHTRLYIPEDLPDPNNDDEKYLQAVADRILKLVKVTNGHTAFLFTSYKALYLIYELIADQLTAYDTICMSKNNKTAISDFKKSENGVLFAAGSMWEGVDCVGDCLSSVIIVRLPFPLRTATLEEKKTHCASAREFIYEYAVPEMLIKLRQGAGRLIRCETDSGCLSILDSRASRTGAYHRNVLQALNKYPLVDSLDDIERFFHNVKPLEYFES